MEIPRRDLIGCHVRFVQGLSDRGEWTLFRRGDDVMGVRRQPDRQRFHAEGPVALGGEVVVVTDDPDDRSTRHVRASESMQRARDPAVGRDHACLVERPDDEGMWWGIGGAYHDGARLTAADGVHRELERETKRRACAHGSERESSDPPEHRDLRRRSVVDVPDGVRRHALPRGRRCISPMGPIYRIVYAI